MTDQELDRLLYAHAGAARDLVLAQLPPEGELPDIPTSPRFQRRMKALIRRADRPGWAKAALRCARQAAVILLVCGTLTFSSLGQDTLCLALQRELVTLSGDCLEPQEWPLPRQSQASPLFLLACAGLQLLLGVPPAEVRLGRGSGASLST